MTARQVFENLRRCLAAAGATFDDVVKLTYFVTDTAHLPAIRAARATHIPDDRLPAASAVPVAALVRPEFLMEIEAPPLPKGVGLPPAVVGRPGLTSVSGSVPAPAPPPPPGPGVPVPR